MKSAILNTISTFTLQIITFLCGLVIPKLILSSFGSDVNGAVQSINQFLNYIILLEAGAGGVVRAALYKPLAHKSFYDLSGIINATVLFFRKIAYIFLVYVVVLSFIYPCFVSEQFDFWFTSSLVIILGVSSFVQYYFGITYQILLTSDSRLYIVNIMQIATIVLNAILTLILVKSGVSIHIVKLVAAVVLILRPIALCFYVKSKYPLLDKTITPNNNLIKQRWDGLGQHLAFFIHNNTDIVVLTLFSSLKSVSVYSIYYMIVSGVERLISCIASGFTPMIGNAIALEDKGRLDKIFSCYELVTFIACSIVYTVCALLIIPFVKLYTNGISDVNYINTLFGMLMVMASALLVIRNIYHNTVLAAGHYKQTNLSAYIEAALNIGISCVLVFKYGICGVAFGTVLSLAYRILYYVFYLEKNLLYRKFVFFIKRLSVNLISLFINIYLFTLLFDSFSNCTDFVMWIMHAFIIFIVVSGVVLMVNYIFYKEDVIYILKKLCGRIRK